LHNDPALGGYIWGIFRLWLMIEMNNQDFFKVVTIILEQVLSYHYVLLLRLGGYRHYAYKGGTSSNYQFWANQEDQLHDPVSTTIMTRHRLFYNPTILVIINQQVLHLQADWKSDKYFKTNIFLSQRFGSQLKWVISYNISLQETNVSKVILKLACLTRIFQKKYLDFLHSQSWNISAKKICYEFMGMYQEGNDKDLKMIRCRLTRIFNLEHNLSKLFWCLFCRISLTWITPN